MAESKKYEITVLAEAYYLPDQSADGEGRYAFGYHITIINTGTVAAQLISRQWQITDAHGQVQEVRGLGVVGEQPLLQPGASHEYDSSAVIGTPVGKMQGSYRFVAEDGVHFEAPIPEFILAMPRVLH